MVNGQAELFPTHEIFDPVRDIEEFHKKFALAYMGKPRLLPSDIRQFRQKFMNEELDEYEEASLDAEFAMSEKDAVGLVDSMEDMFDALIDLVYVALGTAHLHGFNFREGWARVHAANMKKIRTAREVDSKRQSVYDVVKPEGWKAPSHKDLVEDHAHR